MPEHTNRSSLHKRAPKIFLCYSHGDREAVHALYARLKRDGVDAWLDKESLVPGADWERAIREAILKSDMVVVCLSRHFSGQRGYRQEELRIALEKADFLAEDQIFIIPARLEKCATPKRLRGLQRVDLFEAGGYRKLIGVLQRKATAGWI